MNIRVIKLVNGTEFIGQLDVEKSNDNKVRIAKGFQIVYQRVENEGKAGMMPALAPGSMSAEDPRAGLDIDVGREHLLGPAFAPNEMLNQMYQHLTGKVMVPSPRNVIRVPSFASGEKVRPE